MESPLLFPSRIGDRARASNVRCSIYNDIGQPVVTFIEHEQVFKVMIFL